MIKTLQETPQREKTFHPTDKQWEYLNTAIKELTDRPSTIERNCSISRQSWYRWQKNPDFNLWFYAEYRKARQSIIPKLDEIGLKYSNRGNFDFWRAMNQKVGEMPLEGSKADYSVQVNNLIQRQRDEYEL